MPLNLPPDLQAIVDEALASGRYGSAKEVLEAALTQIALDEAHFLALKREIEEGANSPVDARPIGEVFDEIKRRGRETLAARRAAE